MRKMIRTLVFGVVIAAPLLLVPHQSKAGGLLDGLGNLLNDLLGNGNNNGNNGNHYGQNKDKKNTPTTTTPSNSVPLNEGQILLIVAGLGLGAKVINDRRRNAIKSVI